MIGALIGNIVGSRFVLKNQHSKDFELFTEDCFATGDSIMTLAIAKAVMEWKKSKKSGHLGRLAIRYMQALGQRHPGRGYGEMFAKWLLTPNPRPYNSCGNGAAMRVSACGFAASSEKEAKIMARAVTKVSHNHPEGLKGAEALTVAIYMAKTGASKEDIKKRIEADYYPLNFTLDGIRGTYGFDETCQGTVPQAIVAFLESVSFEDAIRNATSIGGDSDTVGAITGALAEAHYGAPEELRNEALCYLDRDLLSIVIEWLEFYSSKQNTAI